MIPSRILVAFDGSDLSARALSMALGIGKAIDAEIHVVYVIKISDYIRFGGHAGPLERSGQISELISEHILKKGTQMEREIAGIAAEYEIPVHVHKKIGDPREEILHLSGIIDADLIMLGSTGSGGLKDILLGSVSDYVARNSPVSTVIVR
jgi:nucleotide-binding universal stress UspA family protein